MNQYAADLTQRMDRRFSKDTSDMSVLEWVCENTTLRNRPFSVVGYEFQAAIINDMHPNLSCKKCSQVGLTEAQIRKLLAFVVRNRAVSAIFTLPNEKMFKRVSKTRVTPIVEKDRVFNPEGRSDSRSMDLLQFNQSFLYLTGCTEGDATSIPADVIFNDEVDLSPQNMLALFNSRLQNSKWKIRQGFSTPSFPAFGIDQSFASSDQHVYLIRCDACNHYNDPQFTRDFIRIPGLPDAVEHLTEIDNSFIDIIDMDNSYVHCEKCKTPLDLANPDLRQWVAKYPDRTHSRGYVVSPFATDRLSPSYIIGQLLKYLEQGFVRGFFNTVLGQTYTDGNIQLTRAAILACMTHQSLVPDVGADVPMAIGVDVGDTCHIVVGTADKKDVILFETVHSSDLVARIDGLQKKYNIVAGGVDRYPYTPTANEIRDKSDGKILPIEYGQAGTELGLQKDKVNPDKINYVRVNRTAAIDLIAGDIRNNQVGFSGYGTQKEVIVDHLRNMVRDEQPEKQAKWVKLSENDHYFHALTFWRAGIDALEMSLALLDPGEQRTTVFALAVESAMAVPDSRLGKAKKSTLAHLPLGMK